MTFSRFLETGVLIFVSLFWQGCGRVAGPPPAAGYNVEPVSYQPAPMPDARVFLIPEGDVTDLQAQPQRIDFTEKVGAKQGLAFQGTVRVPDPDQAGGVVKVEFFRLLPDGRRLFTQTAQQIVPWTDSPDGHLHFRVEMEAPADRGHQFAEVTLYHPPTGGETPFPIAAGEVVVE